MKFEVEVVPGLEGHKGLEKERCIKQVGKVFHWEMITVPTKVDYILLMYLPTKTIVMW